ncbi:hypothetical protein [Alsobacter sp. R-9]
MIAAVRHLPAAVLLAALAAGPAQAQLMLPGAQAPAGGGAPAAPGGSAPGTVVPGTPPAPPRPVAVKAPAESAVLGRTLFFNGTRGRLVIERKDKTALQVTLIAVGEKMSAPGQACGLDLGGGKPLDMTPVGRPDGVPRYRIDIPACALDVDLLDGSVLVSGPTAACPFPEGDCRIDPRGMWGPNPGSLESQLRAIESDRAAADRAVRENFKALLARTKDKNGVKAVASEQAGFTSERETVCRDYSRESVHGFCSARFTELRAAELAARVAALGGPPPVAARPPRPRPEGQPGQPGGAAPPSQPAAAPAPPPPAPSRSIFDIFR